MDRTRRKNVREKTEMIYSRGGGRLVFRSGVYHSESFGDNNWENHKKYKVKNISHTSNSVDIVKDPVEIYGFYFLHGSIAEFVYYKIFLLKNAKKKVVNTYVNANLELPSDGISFSEFFESLFEVICCDLEEPIGGLSVYIDDFLFRHSLTDKKEFFKNIKKLLNFSVCQLKTKNS